MSNDIAKEIDVFLDRWKELRESLDGELRLARRWAWLWFLCFAACVVRRLLENP